jgi:hypothetical protein
MDFWDCSTEDVVDPAVKLAFSKGLLARLTLTLPLLVLPGTAAALRLKMPATTLVWFLLSLPIDGLLVDDLTGDDKGDFLAKMLPSFFFGEIGDFLGLGGAAAFLKAAMRDFRPLFIFL